MTPLYLKSSMDGVRVHEHFRAPKVEVGLKNQFEAQNINPNADGVVDNHFLP